MGSTTADIAIEAMTAAFRICLQSRSEDRAGRRAVSNAAPSMTAAGSGSTAGKSLRTMDKAVRGRPPKLLVRCSKPEVAGSAESCHAITDSAVAKTEKKQRRKAESDLERSIHVSIDSCISTMDWSSPSAAHGVLELRNNSPRLTWW
ncbi:hypothetical protein CERZMDRAFT_110081 [Cercospora zeae-maydis SCOH1-5]|uniref:Uncharacterized protein n=1 Tax=Cercospora zeae-maydis SCOH1-5 TaxID=717836 RepID=A0A6A6FPJ7_9PEZI|nr:hypothetical protein CERZMDRAFT_110081 [Cercospora zeae-maydis SCOH1-5]